GAFEGQDVGVVDDAVDHRRGYDLIPEDVAPANWSWHMFVVTVLPC
ncbi:putative S-layer protein, partial [Mycolicibacterium novocastrense]